MPTLPKIGITIGDIAGVGPEVVAAAITSHAARVRYVPVLIGPHDAWRRVGLSSANYRIHDIPFGGAARMPEMGRPSRLGGRIAFAALARAVELARQGELDACVTAPVSKVSLALAGFGRVGYTELLTTLCVKSRTTAMLMVTGTIRSVIITRHAPLAQVASLLTSGEIYAQSKLCAEFTQSRITHRRVRIGMAALNPHAGDQGLFGTEERRIILPAVQKLRKEGLSVSDPLPTDTLFLAARRGEFDLVVAHYHDQAMLALKLIDETRIVNVTVGLPFLRTSPGHGVAFDIAGHGRADCTSMREAIAFAARYS